MGLSETPLPGIAEAVFNGKDSTIIYAGAFPTFCGPHKGRIHRLPQPGPLGRYKKMGLKPPVTHTHPTWPLFDKEGNASRVANH